MQLTEVKHILYGNICTTWVLMHIFTDYGIFSTYLGLDQNPTEVEGKAPHGCISQIKHHHPQVFSAAPSICFLGCPV